MVAIKGMEVQTDCKKCPFMATDGVDELSPMMCVALWATKHEIKHCVEGRILDDCPLVEVGTCKDCKSIKVLDKEPCEDAVSRASVFEILGNLMSIPYDLDRPINKDDVSESMDAIRVLPSVTPAPKKCHNENHDYNE